MRIVTGHLKGRPIPFNPRRQGRIRLTSSMLKEAVFAMLGGDLSGQAFLDLCSGCGQIGLEAHSRGAGVTLNEPDRRRHGCLASLLRDWSLHEIELCCQKAQSLIPRFQSEERRFHVVYLDPPYHGRWHGAPLCLSLLELLGRSDVLEPDGLVLAQHQAELELPETPGRLACVKERRYGDTTLSIYREGGG